VLTIPEAIWTAMLDVFATVKPDVERVAYLDGVRLGTDGVVTAVVVPNADLHRSWYDVSPKAMSEAAQHAREHGLTRLAQVHSHPGINCEHSPYDDDKAYSQRTDAISIVLPYHATRRPRLEDAGVHVRTQREWVLLSADEAKRHVRCISSLVDLRRDTWNASRTGTKETPEAFWRRWLWRMRSLSGSR